MSARRLGGRVIVVAAVTLAAMLLVGGPSGGDRSVRWDFDLAPIGAVDTVEVTLAVGDRILAVHSQADGRAIHLTTPPPRGAVTVTIDLVLPDGAHRVVRQADAPAGAVVAITVGE